MNDLESQLIVFRLREFSTWHRDMKVEETA